MDVSHVKYCLDANVLIQAWQKYYSPDICPGYWESGSLVKLSINNIRTADRRQ
ncbi:MAG: DUF4411 family protein [Bacteroidota bacterium]